MNLTTLLDMAVAGHGDRVAMGSPQDGTTYAALARLAGGGAAFVTGTKARHVVFVGTNGSALPVLAFAAAAAGVPLVPLNYRLPAERLRTLVARLADPLVVADPAYLTAFAGLGRPAMASADFLARSEGVPPMTPAEVDGDDAAVVLFTSGTTSEPKGVVLTHANLTSYVLQTVDFGSAGPDDAALISTPPYHIAGLGTVLTNVYAGRRMVHLPDFSPAGWLDLVRRERVTSAMLVPTMLARIVEALGGGTARTPRLRSLAYGGARMPLPVLERALAAFPDTGFVNAYGLTETSSTIALLGPEEHREAAASDLPHVRARLASAGRPVPGVEVRIRAADGRALATGDTGLLWVRGPQVSGAYLGQGSVLDEDGWFPTNDRAWLDEAGYLFIEGRADDTIIRGGENIAPAEVEDALVSHPHVRDAAVIGLPDEEWGQRITAVIVLAPGAEVGADELRAWARARLRGSRTPDEVVFTAELPRTATGKIVRREIIAGLDGGNGGDGDGDGGTA